MKQLFTLAALVLSVNAFAFIINEGNTARMSCNREFRAAGSGVQGLACLASTMTSLPTMIIEGQEMDLNTQESSLRLLAEAQGNLEPALLSLIAEDLKLSVEDVQERVLALNDAGVRITVRNVLLSYAE